MAGKGSAAQNTARRFGKSTACARWKGLSSAKSRAHACVASTASSPATQPTRAHLAARAAAVAGGFKHGQHALHLLSHSTRGRRVGLSSMQAAGRGRHSGSDVAVSAAAGRVWLTHAHSHACEQLVTQPRACSHARRTCGCRLAAAAAPGSFADRHAAAGPPMSMQVVARSSASSTSPPPAISSAASASSRGSPF